MFNVVQTPNGAVMVPASGVGAGVARLTTSTLPHLYRDGIFSLCADDGLISLTLGPQSNKLANWLDWESTNVKKQTMGMIPWVRGDEGTRQGWLADPCGDANSVEFGEIEIEYDTFGRLRRASPVTDITEGAMRMCDRQPRYRLDGTRINDELEFRAVLTAEGVAQDFASQIIVGNKSTAGQFDGLRRIIRTGFTDRSGVRSYLMDSIIIDWNHRPVSGGAGITWTDGRGARAVPSNANLVDVLRSIWRIIMIRAKMAPALASRGFLEGEAIIVATDEIIHELKDLFTYWSLYDGQQYYEAVYNSADGRQFRESLNGGLYGDGYIDLHGFRIHFISYGYELMTGPASSEVMLLVKSCGGFKTLWGQHIDMNEAASLDRYNEFSASGTSFMASDNGRFLHFQEEDKTCIQQFVELRPRLVALAPWSLARIQNVRPSSIGGHIGSDPMDSSFFPESSFPVAAA